VSAVWQAERDALKSTVEMQSTLISDLQMSVSQKTDELSSANEQVLSLLLQNVTVKAFAVS